MCGADVCKCTHTGASVGTCRCVAPEGGLGSAGQGASHIKAEEGSRSPAVVAPLCVCACVCVCVWSPDYPALHLGTLPGSAPDPSGSSHSQAMGQRSVPSLEWATTSGRLSLADGPLPLIPLSSSSSRTHSTLGLKFFLNFRERERETERERQTEREKTLMSRGEGQRERDLQCVLAAQSGLTSPSPDKGLEG